MEVWGPGAASGAGVVPGGEAVCPGRGLIRSHRQPAGCVASPRAAPPSPLGALAASSSLAPPPIPHPQGCGAYSTPLGHSRLDCAADVEQRVHRRGAPLLPLAGEALGPVVDVLRRKELRNMDGGRRGFARSTTSHTPSIPTINHYQSQLLLWQTPDFKKSMRGQTARLASCLQGRVGGRVATCTPVPWPCAAGAAPQSHRAAESAFPAALSSLRRSSAAAPRGHRASALPPAPPPLIHMTTPPQTRPPLRALRSNCNAASPPGPPAPPPQCVPAAPPAALRVCAP